MRKIKKDDQVVVIAGKDKGREGTVLRIIEVPQRGKKGLCVKAVVGGVNMVKKHVKANPQINKPGGIVEQEAPIQVSNVAIVNPATGKADRVGFRVLEDGTKVRYFKSNGEVIDV